MSIFFLLLVTQAVAQTFPKVEGQWLYFDRYTFKYLSICEDSSFLWYTSSCTYSYHIAGTMKIDNDTLILVGSPILNSGYQAKYSAPEKTLKFLLHKNYIYTYSENPPEYIGFQALSRTPAKDLSEAISLRRNWFYAFKRSRS